MNHGPAELAISAGGAKVAPLEHLVRFRATPRRAKRHGRKARASLSFTVRTWRWSALARREVCSSCVPTSSISGCCGAQFTTRKVGVSRYRHKTPRGVLFVKYLANRLNTTQASSSHLKAPHGIGRSPTRVPVARCSEWAHGSGSESSLQRRDGAERRRSSALDRSEHHISLKSGGPVPTVPARCKRMAAAETKLPLASREPSRR